MNVIMDLNQAVFTTIYVLQGAQITIVYHSIDESWQFFSEEGFESEDDAKLVALSTILHLQPHINDIAWLPAGMEARYQKDTSEWQTSISPPEE
jgi:hypothetical protein